LTFNLTEIYELIVNELLNDLQSQTIKKLL